MRTFYLFDVKENILKNYRNNYEELYSLLESIHYLKTEDIILGFNIYQRIVNPMKKEEYNDYIKKNNLGKENYICYNYTHTINDFYFNESTKMIINNSHIKIKTNNIPNPIQTSFFPFKKDTSYFLSSMLKFISSKKPSDFNIPSNTFISASVSIISD